MADLSRAIEAAAEAICLAVWHHSLSSATAHTRETCRRAAVASLAAYLAHEDVREAGADAQSRSLGQKAVRPGDRIVSGHIIRGITPPVKP